MTKWTALAAVALFSAVVLGNPVPPEPKAPKPRAAGEYDFGTKIVVVARKDKESYLLAKARVRMLGDRAFIAGEYPDEQTAKWPTLKGVVMWQPLANVSGLFEFDSYQAAMQYYESAKSRRKSDKDGDEGPGPVH